MNSAITFLPTNWIEALGWTILHSLWQGALIGGIAWIALRALRNFDARTRYRVAFAALVLIPLLAVGTFIKVYEPQQATTTSFNAAAYYYMTNTGITNGAPAAAEGFHWISLLPYVVLLWVAGSAFFALRFIGGLVFLQRLRYSEQRGLPWHINAQLVEWKRKLSISRTVRIAESALARTPMLIGYFKPVILLPLGCAAGLPKEQLEALIAHELAHVVRHDFIFNLVQELVRIVFFYHPGVWWLNSVIRDERESCCDEIAFGLGVEKISLAKALAALEEQKLQQPELALAAVGRGNLMQRIRRMFRQAPAPSMRERVGASALLLIGLLVITTSVTIAQTIKDKKAHDKKESSASSDAGDNGDTLKDTKKKKPPVPPVPPVAPVAPVAPGAPVPPMPPSPPQPPNMPGTAFAPFSSLSSPYAFAYSGSPMPMAFASEGDTAQHIKIKRDKKGRVTEIWIDGKSVDPNSEQGKSAMVWGNSDDWEAYAKQWEEYGKQWEEWSKQLEKNNGNLGNLNLQLGKMPNCAPIVAPVIPPMNFSFGGGASAGSFGYGYSYSDGEEPSNPKIDSLRRALDEEIAKENARKRAKDEADFEKQEQDFRKQDEDFRKQEEDFRKQDEDFRKQNAEFEKQQAEFMKQQAEFLKKQEAYTKENNKVMTKIETELLGDKLITDQKNYTFTVSKKELIVNGKKQSEELHQKYFNIAKKVMGDNLDDDDSYTINKNSN